MTSVCTVKEEGSGIRPLRLGGPLRQTRVVGDTERRIDYALRS